MRLFDPQGKEADATGANRLIHYSEDLLEQLGCRTDSGESCEGME